MLKYIYIMNNINPPQICTSSITYQKWYQSYEERTTMASTTEGKKPPSQRKGKRKKEASTKSLS